MSKVSRQQGNLTCSASHSVTRRRELLLTHNNNEGQTQENDIHRKTREGEMSFRRCQEAFGRFQVHVSKPHKELNYQPSAQGQITIFRINIRDNKEQEIERGREICSEAKIGCLFVTSGIPP